MTIDEAIEELNTQSSVRFARLLLICEIFFGPPRIKGSHHIFKMPWPGDPRINLQKSKGGKAKAYQVQQVISALYRLSDDPGDNDE